MMIESVTLVLENCDEITFNSSEIKALRLDNISRSVSGSSFNGFHEYVGVQDFAISLYPSANGLYCEFGNEKWKRVKFERLRKWRDITQIELAWVGGSKELIFPDYREEEYDGKTGVQNAYEKIWTSERGGLYIVISKTKDIDDFFNRSVENRKENEDDSFKRSYKLYSGEKTGDINA